MLSHKLVFLHKSILKQKFISDFSSWEKLEASKALNQMFYFDHHVHRLIAVYSVVRREISLCRISAEA